MKPANRIQRSTRHRELASIDFVNLGCVEAIRRLIELGLKAKK